MDEAGNFRDDNFSAMRQSTREKQPAEDRCEQLLAVPALMSLVLTQTAGAIMRQIYLPFQQHLMWTDASAFYNLKLPSGCIAFMPAPPAHPGLLSSMRPASLLSGHYTDMFQSH